MLKSGTKSYDQLLHNEKQLAGYLQYIRHKKKPLNITIEHPYFEEKSHKENKIHQKPAQTEVIQYVNSYMKILKEVNNLESYATKKIFKCTIHFLEEFPTMSFLYEVINAFGKVQKKLEMNEAVILNEATDDMIPLFQKIIEKIESLKKQSESKKLMELGHRIEHLQDMVKQSKSNFSLSDPDFGKIFKKFEPDRIEKYVVMEDSITKAEKRFGNFSHNFIKNRQVFSNLNRVYEDIRKHEKKQAF